MDRHDDGPEDAAPEMVDPIVLEDRRARFEAYRPVSLPGGLGWERGMDPEYLSDVVTFWARSYNPHPPTACGPQSDGGIVEQGPGRAQLPALLHPAAKPHREGGFACKVGLEHSRAPLIGIGYCVGGRQ